MRPFAVAAPIVFLLIAASASASTVLSNTGNPTDGSASLNASTLTFTFPVFGGTPVVTVVSTATAVATSFTTSNVPLSLESVTLLLNSGTGAGALVVSLYSDAAGAPSDLLTTLSGASTPFFPAPYTYSAGSGGYMLDANTTYWVHAQFNPPATGNVNGIILWSETSDLTETSPEGWTLGTKVTRTLTGNVPGVWTPDSTKATLFSVNAVPEPGSAVLAALSGALLLQRRRTVGA